MKFFPGKFYEFTVTGAGMLMNTSPVQGDERYVFRYTGVQENPRQNSRTQPGVIGSGKGIKDGASYNIYILPEKQIYNGKEWEELHHRIS